MAKDWQQTASGRKVHPLAFSDEELSFRDVAHALGNMCRYNGHTKDFYSVAEHCCHVSDLLEDRYKLMGLVHDAAEAYVVDLPAPIKHMDCFAPYREAEERIEKIIAERLGLEFPFPPPIKYADHVVYVAEVRDLMQPKHPEWALPAVRAEFVALVKVNCWTPKWAAQEWLNRFYKLARREDAKYEGRLLQFTPRGQERGGDTRHGVVGGVPK